MRKVAFVLLSLFALAGCNKHQMVAAQQLFVSQAGASDAGQLTVEAHPSRKPFGQTIDASNASPKTDYIEVFAVTSGPLAGRIGADPTFAKAPAKLIGYVARAPFPHSVKVSLSTVAPAGQLVDGAAAHAQGQAFGYAIAPGGQPV